MKRSYTVGETGINVRPEYERRLSSNLRPFLARFHMGVIVSYSTFYCYIKPDTMGYERLCNLDQVKLIIIIISLFIIISLHFVLFKGARFYFFKIYTENPEWIIWLIWAIVCHYTDKKDSFSHIFESFCPCTDPLWLKWVKWFTRVFLCSFLFHLKNHHSKDVNFKFHLKRSSRLDVRSNFVYCSC